MKLNLPFWLNEKEIDALKKSAQSWWLLVSQWVKWPLTQSDALTCHELILDLLAYQRGIKRFSGESLDLYRLRVKFAFINGVDSGLVAGLRRIFRRLGVGEVTITERDPAKDWDVITIGMDDQQISQNNKLIQEIMRQYGRTCRRYEISSTALLQVGVTVVEFSVEIANDHAEF